MLFRLLINYVNVVFSFSRTAQNETLLLVAIRHQLEPVADRLCDLGAEVGVSDASGNSPLWVALRSRQESVAAKLVGTTTTIHMCMHLCQNIRNFFRKYYEIFLL